MNKLKFLSVISIGLLVSNLALVGFILFKKPGPPREMGPKEIIIKKLNFDENQIKEYDDLIQWHRGEISKADRKIMKLKNQLYETLTVTQQTTLKDSLISEIGNLQTKIENIHYKHFLDIQKLCKAEQKKAFTDLTREIGMLFAPPHPPVNDKKRR